MKKILFLALAALLTPVFAVEPASRSLKGVTMPAQIARDGKTLNLNGMGLRTKVVFKVYVGGLYLEKQSNKAEEIIAADNARLMELSFLRNVDGKAIGEAIKEGFEKNSKDQLPGLNSRLTQFRGLIPNLRKGDRLAFVYLSGKGTTVEYNGKPTGIIPDKDFSDALFKCWIGASPADQDLKKGLLGI